MEIGEKMNNLKKKLRPDIPLPTRMAFPIVSRSRSRMNTTTQLNTGKNTRTTSHADVSQYTLMSYKLSLKDKLGSAEKVRQPGDGR